MWLLKQVKKILKKYVYILYMIESLKNYEWVKIKFKIYLKIKKNEWTFMNNLLLVFLFSY
jgi:uncharacterized protein YqgQ